MDGALARTTTNEPKMHENLKQETLDQNSTIQAL